MNHLVIVNRGSSLKTITFQVTIIMQLVFTAAICGCGGSAPSAKPSSTASGSGASTSATATTTASGSSGAVALAKGFLGQLAQGQPDLAKLTPEFKKVIGPPTTSSDQERGYSEWAAAEWFKALPKVPTDAAPSEVDLGHGLVAVLVNVTPKSGPILIKLVKSGSDYQIDWFAVGLAGIDASLTSSEKSAEFAFLAFLNAALTGQTELAEALMTLTLKARIAPPLPGDQGYNKGIVKSKLQGLRGNATAYTISKRNLGPESGAVDGSLLGGEPKTRPFSVKLVKGTKPGEWLVDDFEPR